VAYTKEEIKNFAEKDLRISKLAIVKSLIEKLLLEDVYEVNKVKVLAEKYVDYIYAKRGQVGCVAESTEHKVIDEYKKANKASANPADILVHIINTFGKYPTKTESIEKVVKSFIER